MPGRRRTLAPEKAVNFKEFHLRRKETDEIFIEVGNEHEYLIKNQTKTHHSDTCEHLIITFHASGTVHDLLMNRERNLVIEIRCMVDRYTSQLAGSR